MKLKRIGTVHDTITGYDFRIDAALSRAKAIRAKCLECAGGSTTDVRRCRMSDCPLWPWRTGRTQRAKTVGNAQVSE